VGVGAFLIQIMPLAEGTAETIMDASPDSESQVRRQEAMDFTYQTVKGLYGVHEVQGFVHGDVKLSNSQPPVVTKRPNHTLAYMHSFERQWKLADGGLSVPVSPGDSQIRYLGGSDPYLSPEAKQARVAAGEAKYNGKAADIFALGVAFSKRYTGRYPGNVGAEVRRRTRECVGEKLWESIEMMVVDDWTKRPRAADLLQAFEAIMNSK
jgi:serine/threonine protein kinase